ncbi:MAG: type II secretion system GspH family protein [Coriobacteriales bacterium]|nr:type II secretion system GspH family protein [Coriobacteriales bacterium]
MKSLVKRQQELRKNGKKGFTLVELIVVIVILGILMAIAVPSLVGYIQKARDEGARAETTVARSALQTILSEGSSNVVGGVHVYNSATGQVQYTVSGEDVEFEDPADGPPVIIAPEAAIQTLTGALYTGLEDVTVNEHYALLTFTITTPAGVTVTWADGEVTIDS